MRLWRIGLNLAFALLILFWLARLIVPGNHGGLLSFWGKPGMSPAMLEESTILCSGHFSSHWQPFSWCWSVELPPENNGRSFGESLRARRKIVPFYVDHYWKGKGPGEIGIALFEPAERFWGDAWLIPAEENLLVALKEDTTGGGGYQLVNQVNSWLVMSSTAPLNTTSPEQAIQTCALDYLERYAAGPEAQRPVKLLAPLTIDSISGLGGTVEVNNLTVVREVLATVSEFHMNDERTVAVLKKLLVAPEPTMQIHSSPGVTTIKQTLGSPVQQAALLTLDKIDATQVYDNLQDRLADYNAASAGTTVSSGKPTIAGNDHFNFPAELSEAILNADHFEKLTPLILSALGSPDSRMRLFVAQALREVQTKDNGGFQHGNQLGRQFYPALAKLLDDPDREVRYTAMGCIFEMSGCVEQPFGHRDLELWATQIVEQNPDFYVGQYKEWWEKHKSELGP